MKKILILLLLIVINCYSQKQQKFEFTSNEQTCIFQNKKFDTKHSLIFTLDPSLLKGTMVTNGGKVEDFDIQDLYATNYGYNYTMTNKIIKFKIRLKEDKMHTHLYMIYENGLILDCIITIRLIVCRLW